MSLSSFVIMCVVHVPSMFALGTTQSPTCSLPLPPSSPATASTLPTPSPPPIAGSEEGRMG